tara:strand:- start:897 stop:1553 length:657 start_codon:yes stop_codon:yes gene_type:complete
MISIDSPFDLSTKLLAHLPKDGGFFIEAGANNGVWQSNTLALETEKGWHGLLIEPNHQKFLECKTNRPHHKNIFYHGALVAFDYKKKYIQGYFGSQAYGDALMAQVADDYTAFDPQNTRWENQQLIDVPALKLSNILDHHKIEVIDFLSLDVEGYELHALNGLDLNRHRPHTICVECWGKEPQHHNHQLFVEINEKFAQYNYKLEKELTASDFIFTPK